MGWEDFVLFNCDDFKEKIQLGIYSKKSMGLSASVLL